MKGLARLWVAILIAGVPSMISGQSSTGGPDIYELQVIRGALKLQSMGVVRSTTQKVLGRLGDRVSIGLLKILDEKDRAKPEVVGSFLPVIRAAFPTPQFISNEEDKRPDVTLLFLDWIRGQTGDAEIRTRISEVEAFVRQQAALPSR
jgi:hypothetical protein